MKKIILLVIAALFAVAPMSAQRVKSLREIQRSGRTVNRNVNSSCPFTWLSTRYVTQNDLYGMSGSKLRILRNAIYAMHGYRFKSADLHNYFSKYSWYTPRYNDVTRMLNRYEQYNVNFIRSFE